MNEMFCFQCEQTAGGTGCTRRAGVCGKTAGTAALQDDLTGAMIGLAQALGGGRADAESIKLVKSALFMTVTNVNFDDGVLEDEIRKMREKKNAVKAGAPDYDMNNIWNAELNIRSLKSLVLFGLRGMAAYAYHAMVLGFIDGEVDAFFFKALSALGEESPAADALITLSMELGNVNLKCMELLDSANTGTYGNPVPTEVPLTVEKGPFIVISGHDLKDLELLLRQTEGKGINIYTHGEMLPAHAYPKLKAFGHLKGNFGTAWQSQQKEFLDIPAPVLFTTNCLMPPKDNYSDRIYTTEVVAYPGLVHIGEDKDFSPVIQRALELGGYKEDTEFTGINGGKTVTVGFGHNTVLSVADTVIDAVKSGAIKRFFLVGGCDGARPGRNYYTDFVKKTPADSVILTLACGKYRFNDLQLGSIGGLPRLMDMGQCNDAYSAVKVALALADAFKCGVNDLPLSLILSWYEQKAVCILLSLLALGVKNIYLGPTLPAFLSPDVAAHIVSTFGLKPTSTADADLQAIMA